VDEPCQLGSAAINPNAVILSERSESKDPYSCKKSKFGRLAQQYVRNCWATKGFLRLLAALVTQDDTQKYVCSWIIPLKARTSHARRYPNP